MKKCILLLFGMMIATAHIIAETYQTDSATIASGSYTNYISSPSFGPPINPPQPPGESQLYTLTVVNGTISGTNSQSGKYKLNDTITVVANTPPSGKVFDKWTCNKGIFKDPNAANTIYVMPDTVATITATYKDIPPSQYAVTVTGGTGATGSGSYAAGATVNISAGTPPANQQFKNWTTSSTGVTFANANSSNTSFTMPANAVTVTANFEAIPIVNAQTPTITSQPQNATVNVGETVSLSVTASVTDGGTLSYQWYKGGSAISGATNNAYSPSTATEGTTNYYVVVTNTNSSVNGTKTATANSNQVTVIVSAVPVKTYAVTVNGGTGATGSGNYTEGATVNISAGTPPAGQQFKNWTTTSAGVTFANANNSSTSFTMPASAVTVTANFEAIPIVNAQTPTINPLPQSTTVKVGDAINLSVKASVTDGGSLSYQWYKENTAINGATGSTFPPSTATEGTTNYYVVVTNTNNSVNGTKTAFAKSTTITVIVNAAPVKTFTVNFNVNASDAVITLNGVTNPAGNYVFTGLKAGTYSYTATRKGYKDVTGTAVVNDQDITVKVDISTPTGINNIKTGTKIYAENATVQIESAAAIKFVEIYSITGQLVRQIRVDANQVNIYNLQRGIIVVKIFLQGENYEIRKVLMR